MSHSATPWTAALHVSLSLTISWSLPAFIAIESEMLSDHLILCRPLLLLPSIFPSIRVIFTAGIGLKTTACDTLGIETLNGWVRGKHTTRSGGAVEFRAGSSRLWCTNTLFQDLPGSVWNHLPHLPHQEHVRGRIQGLFPYPFRNTPSRWSVQHLKDPNDVWKALLCLSGSQSRGDLRPTDICILPAPTQALFRCLQVTSDIYILM